MLNLWIGVINITNIKLEKKKKRKDKNKLDEELM